MNTKMSHHYVAKALIHELEKGKSDWICNKVDILSDHYGYIERAVYFSYLLFIKFLPELYNWIYYHMAYNKPLKSYQLCMYDLLFSYPLNQVIKRKNPNVIVCTHALPSRIVSFLKQKEKTDVIAINVYTDYFINKVWAIQGIDYHLVSTPRMKKALIDQGVSEASIFLTGIPVHPVFRGNNYKVKKKIVPKSILF